MKKYTLLSTALLLAVVFFLSPSCSKPAKETAKYVDSVNLVKALPEWAKSANIYEVNVRQYTPEGTFKAFEANLPRLKEMGVDILWIMPINPIGVKNRKGSLGSYYASKNYMEINPEYGTLDDFKSLVKKIHEMGMYIIVDWVANHTGWDNNWIEPHKDWYQQDSAGNVVVPKGTDWSDVAGLNYNNKDLRTAMLSAMTYWMKDIGIDGYRCDVAGMVPIDFWKRARKTLDSIKPNGFFLAEDDNSKIHQAFDMSYSWTFLGIENNVAKGKNTAQVLDTLLTKEASEYQSADLKMRFTSNHDENTWSGTEYERLGDGAETFAVLCYGLPGMPLIYCGQEEPLKKRLKFFDKDTIQWGKYEKKEFYTKLNQLKKQNKALWNGTFGGTITKIENSNPKAVFAFVRQKDENKVVFIFNLTNAAQEVKLNNEQAAGNYLNYFTGAKETYKKDNPLKLKPWEYIVLIAQ